LVLGIKELKLWANDEPRDGSKNGGCDDSVVGFDSFPIVASITSGRRKLVELMLSTPNVHIMIFGTTNNVFAIMAERKTQVIKMFPDDK
jgi:hypothetical protein